MGIARPGDMGFDIVHFNLHKTFTQPHGGGGPGAGPIAVSDRIEPFLPRPQVVRRGGDNGGEPRSTSTTTGPSRSAACAASRATSACSCAPTPTSARSGADGLRDVSETAVLNANYLLARLAEQGDRASTCRWPSTAPACTSSCSRARGAKEKLRRQDARPGQAHARPRRAPADGLLPAAGRRGADDRADRDRDARAPGRLRRRRPRRSSRGSRGPLDRPQRARTRLRCAGSTRRRRRSARSCAGGGRASLAAWTRRRARRR